jgi:hypothetical protein
MNKINSDLLLEVNRYLNMMGLEEKILISEGSFFDEISDGARLLLRKVHNIPNVPTKVMVNGEEVLRTLYKKFVQVIDGDIPISSLTQLQLKQFAKILRTDPEIVNEVYTNLIKQSVESNPKLTEEKFLRIIQSKIDAGETIGEILRKTFNNDELAVGLLEQKLTSKLSQLANNRFIPDPNIIPVPKILSKTPEGVKRFQKWLNLHYPNWYKGGKIGKSNFGKFAKETEDAWKLYKNKFLIPKDLVNEDGVTEFQKWMNKNYKDWYKGKVLPSNFFGKYGTQTSKAWVKFKDEFINDNPLRRALKNSTNKLEQGYTPKYDLAQIDFFRNFATDKTLTDTIRRNLYSMYQSWYASSTKRLQTVTDQIVGKIDAAYDAKILDAKEYDTIYREIGIQIQALKQESEVSVDLLYEMVESSIKKAVRSDGSSFNESELKTIMEAIKTKSNFNENNAWLLKMLKESSYSNWYKQMTDKTKSWFRKILVSIERGVTFLLTGHVRTLKEIADFAREKGFLKGMGTYALWLYTLKYGILPAFYGVANVFRIMYEQLRGNEEYLNPELTVIEAAWETVKTAFEETYMRNLLNDDGSYKSVGEYINPFDFPLGKLIEIQGENAQGKYSRELEDKLEKWANDNKLSQIQRDILKEKFRLSSNYKQAIIDAQSTFDKEGSASIMNNKLGFIAWCKLQKPPLTPDPAYPWSETPIEGTDVIEKVGLTSGGKQWVYDDKAGLDKKGSFVPF